MLVILNARAWSWSFSFFKMPNSLKSEQIHAVPGGTIFGELRPVGGRPAFDSTLVNTWRIALLEFAS